jgi:hypothetical protein
MKKIHMLAQIKSLVVFWMLDPNALFILMQRLGSFLFGKKSSLYLKFILYDEKR